MVKQYSIDIEMPETKDGQIIDIPEEDIRKCLTLDGYEILCLSWRATWLKTETYEQGS